MNSQPYIDPLEGMLGRKCDAIRIGGRAVGAAHPTYVIAEIGINHNGSLERAKALVDAAAAAGCDAVKFQKRTLEELYTRAVLEHPNRFEEGFQYFIPILREVEFGRAEFDVLYQQTRRAGLEFLCTAFDETAVDFLDPYRLAAYKVASADFGNFILLEKLASKGKPLLLSTGMSPQEEIDAVAAFLFTRNIPCMLLHCVSAYPTPVEDAHLRFIHTLRERYGVPVGFSGHEVGFEVTLAAVAAGACLVERHVTLDRRMEGPDHTSSLEPEELRELVRRIRVIDRAMGSPRRVVSRGVVRTQEVLSKSLVATRDLEPGTQIRRDMVTAKAPAKGLSPLHLHDLIGRRLRRPVKQDECFLAEDLEEADAVQRVPVFETAWGLKGRFHDLDFVAQYRPTFLEIHLNDQDLDYPFEELHRGKRYPYGLALHCPTYWFRSVVNLASKEEAERRTHIRIVQRVIDMARRLAGCFTGTPAVIVHLGGMDIEELKDGAALRELAYDSLRALDWDGVRFLPENMPPRPWYFSGQWFDNAFCSAEDMLEVCRLFGLRMCLDLSHAKLYCNDTGDDYWRYLKAVAPLTAHLHVSDAYGIDGEGVQIGEGEIDFGKVFALLARETDLGAVSWTPEIWQGHLHQHRGSLTALERLAAIPELRPVWPAEVAGARA